MNYVSTRNKDEIVSSAKAITKGISDDGGLFVPATIPELTMKEITSLINMNYASRANVILKQFLSDFADDEIKQCTELAYSKENFSHDNIAPLYSLTDNMHLLELWHGPTCAFKDMALQILPHLMRVSASKEAKGRKIVILVATSGDTGKAALEGFKNAENTYIIVFYPQDGVSPMQKLQMATQEGNNVEVCAIKGNFDDAQNGVKSIFTNSDINEKLNNNNLQFSSANSINWGRLVPQIVYYFSAYCDLIQKEKIKTGEAINIVVPTGNFGNILAAYYAGKMGLPVAKLICASNKNKVLTDFINSGVYDSNREFHTTSSPSMDILISSNLERLLFELSDKDDKLIANLMNQLANDGRYEIDSKMKKKLSDIFVGGWCSDQDTANTIKDIYNKHNYLCDTHTAVGVHVYNEYVKNTNDKTHTVIASTANPYKFADSVLEAVTDINVSKLNDFEKLDKLNEITQVPIPTPLSNLQNKKIRFKGMCQLDQMANMVLDTLEIK